MNVNLAAQFVGLMAMVLLLITYQMNNRRAILIFHVCISLCWIVHYGMLGAISGVVINIICFIRNVIFNGRERYPWADHPFLPGVICLAEILSILYVWQSPIDILAMVGAPLQTIALWQKKPSSIRLLMFTASPLWLLYDLFNGSYTGIVTECITMLSIIIATVKYRKNKQTAC